MSEQVQVVEHTTPAPAAGGVSPWSLTWHGIRTIAVLELRQRVRSTRWIVSLVVFAVLVGGVTALTWAFTRDPGYGDVPDDPSAGTTMFGFIAFFVLFLGLLVSPTLSATAINGDRNAGTLATLQVTLLSAAEIVLGKLLAAWVASLAFLVVSSPFLVWALLAGGASPLRMVVTLLVLAALLAVVCAVGLGFSALTSRTAGSAVLTYVATASLSVVTLILFGLSLPLVTQEDEVRVQQQVWSGNADDEVESCRWETMTIAQAHTERTWWLLAINPFVILADAAPEQSRQDGFTFDPLTGIREGVRTLRLGPATEQDWCYLDDEPGTAGRSGVYDLTGQERDPSSLSPVWPWGLGAHLLLGAGAVVVAVRRLTVPQRHLPKNTRVA